MGGDQRGSSVGDGAIIGRLGALGICAQREAHSGSHVGDGHGWDSHGRRDRGIESAVGGRIWQPGEQCIGCELDGEWVSDVQCE